MYPNRLTNLLAVTGLIAAIAITPPPRATAQQPASEVVVPFLDENTVVIVGWKPGAVQAQTLRPLVAPLLPGREHFVLRLIARADAMDAALRQAGVDELYVVVSFTDQFADMPFVVIPDTGSVDAAAMAESIEQWQDRDVQTRKMQGAIVFGAAATLDRLEQGKSAAPPEFVVAREAVGDADAWAVMMASDDQRRAIEAMQPELPAVMGGGDTRRLTRGIKWIALAVDAPPNAAVRLVVKAPDAAAAAGLQQWTKAVLDALQQHRRLVELWPQFAEHADKLTPQVVDDQLQLTFDPPDASLQRLVELVSKPIQRMLIDEARRRALNDLKLLALAMHNYHDTHGHFPPAASRDPQGRPLLSWRVALLPFLDQAELYQQFHLDEPWDSEHNRSLIPRMPDVFRVPLSRHLPSDGLASYGVPGGEKTIFPPLGKISFRDIKDGTSNTILIVEVDDDHAQVWTKPGAYPIDMQQPAAGLGGHFDNVFLYARGDGSGGAAPLSLPVETLRAIFTRAGGELTPEF